MSLDVEVACYGYEGVDAVKAALKEGLSASTEEMPVKVKFPFSVSSLVERRSSEDQFDRTSVVRRYCDLSRSQRRSGRLEERDRQDPNRNTEISRHLQNQDGTESRHRRR